MQFKKMAENARNAWVSQRNLDIKTGYKDIDVWNV